MSGHLHYTIHNFLRLHVQFYYPSITIKYESLKTDLFDDGKGLVSIT